MTDQSHTPEREAMKIETGIEGVYFTIGRDGPWLHVSVDGVQVAVSIGNLAIAEKEDGKTILNSPFNVLYAALMRHKAAGVE